MQWFTKAYQVPWYVGKISNRPPIYLIGGPYPALQLVVGLLVFLIAVTVLFSVNTTGKALAYSPIAVGVAGFVMYLVREVRLDSGAAQLQGLTAWLTRTSPLGFNGTEPVKIRPTKQVGATLHRPVPVPAQSDLPGVHVADLTEPDDDAVPEHSGAASETDPASPKSPTAARANEAKPTPTMSATVAYIAEYTVAKENT